MKNALVNAPAGERSREARMLAVSRAALAAQIRQGRPLAEILPALIRAAGAEEVLLAAAREESNR